MIQMFIVNVTDIGNTTLNQNQQLVISITNNTDITITCADNGTDVVKREGNCVCDTCHSIKALPVQTCKCCNHKAQYSDLPKPIENFYCPQCQAYREHYGYPVFNINNN